MHPAGGSTRSGLRIRTPLVWLGFVLAIGLLLFTYRYLGSLSEGIARDFRRPLIEELTAALGAGLLFWPVLWLVRRLPLTASSWLRRLPLYVLAVPIFTGLHTSMNWGLREIGYRLAGLGDYDYGLMPLRYFMEAPIDLVGFTVMVAILHGVAWLRTARERELRTARLEASLARAQLRNLRLQLQPHFLFNALNTISSTMYRDPEAADEMLDRLSELLRASLRTAQTDEVPLATELEMLEHYLALLRARFSDRLSVTFQIASHVRTALVPSMLLQPLIENAVRHGEASRTGRGAVEVRAHRRGDRLVLEIEDDGPGAEPGADLTRKGVGLSAIRERLQLLYGEEHGFETRNVKAGFLVRITLPCRHAVPEEPVEEPMDQREGAEEDEETVEAAATAPVEEPSTRGAA